MSDGISVWVPVISASAGILGALGSQWLSHIFITRREKRASEEKQNRERYFIATELVFLLERFAQRCVLSAYEPGDYDENGYIRIDHTLPDIDYAGVAGDWRSLPSELMYRLSQIPVLRDEACRSVASALFNEIPYDGAGALHELNSQSCRLGLRAIRVSRDLRRVCVMPDDNLSAYSWSTWRALSVVRGGIIEKELRLRRNVILP